MQQMEEEQRELRQKVESYWGEARTLEAEKEAFEQEAVRHTRCCMLVALPPFDFCQELWPPFDFCQENGVLGTPEVPPKRVVHGMALLKGDCATLYSLGFAPSQHLDNNRLC